MGGLYKGETVYDHSNYKSLVGDGKQVHAEGEMRLLSALPKPAGKDNSSFSCPFASAKKHIPRSDYSAAIKEQAAIKSRVSDYCDFPAYDQNGIPYCWANGPSQAATMMRRIMGLPLVRFSSASIGGPITGYVSRGGYEGDALEYLVKHGAVDEQFWPNNAISRKYDTPETQANRKLHKVLEAFECHSFEDWADGCLGCLPGAFAYNWMGHVMAMSDLVEIEANSFGLRVRNSWKDSWGAKNDLGFGGFAVFREGHGTPDSGFFLRQVTVAAA